MFTLTVWSKGRKATPIHTYPNLTPEVAFATKAWLEGEGATVTMTR